MLRMPEGDSAGSPPSCSGRSRREGAADLFLDRPESGWSFHVLFEVATLGLSLGAVAYLWLGWRDVSRTLRATRSELDSRGAERDAWRARAEKTLRGLGEAIDGQLREWGLTPAERETALLLLKGIRPQGDRSAPAQERAHGAAARGRRSTGNRASPGEPSCPRSSSRICCCP